MPVNLRSVTRMLGMVSGLPAREIAAATPRWSPMSLLATTRGRVVLAGGGGLAAASLGVLVVRSLNSPEHVAGASSITGGRPGLGPTIDEFADSLGDVDGLLLVDADSNSDGVADRDEVVDVVTAWDWNANGYVGLPEQVRFTDHYFRP